MSLKKIHQEIRITESQLADILARAIQLDSRHVASYDPAEVQAIAEEAGIRPESIRRALTEFHSRPTDMHAVPNESGTLRAAAAGAAVGLGTGTILALARVYANFIGDAIYFSMFGMALLAPLTIALIVVGARRHRRFQISNLATWITVALAWSIVGGPTSEPADLLFVTGTLAGMSSAAGAAILWCRNQASRLGRLGARVLAAFRREPAEAHSREHRRAERIGFGRACARAAGSRI
jgi:hypothetical protein